MTGLYFSDVHLGKSMDDGFLLAEKIHRRAFTDLLFDEIQKKLHRNADT